ncbi:MAG: NF038129 family PEP-CTERM protein, partial [Pirellulaceae bacterium]|nr:NF038129 family PEP-CTERM protein [Pirellulaceae bacterium]
MRFNETVASGVGSGKGARPVGGSHRHRSGHRRAQHHFFQPTVETLEQRTLLAALAARPYDLSPLAFERNEGQLAADVAYAARGADFNLLVTNNGVVLGLGGSALATGARAGGGPGQTPSRSRDQFADGTTTELLVQMSWLNGREAATVEGLNQQPGVTNYVWGDDPSAWHTGIASFERVRYDEVYDGIDLEFYGRAGDIEFDWIVAPHVDPSQITMVYAGMDDLSLDADGNLVITAASQALVQQAPFVYQVIAGQQRQVAGRYLLGEAGAVGFALGEYDPQYTLVIDPVLSYSTYLGGSSNEAAADVASDAEGNTYVIGTTGSETLAGQETGPGTFVAKFKPDGQIAYVTALGPAARTDANGFAQSYGEAVAIGPDRLPYVVFLTVEGEFLTYTSTLQLHVSKLNAAGIPVFDTLVPVPDEVTATAPFGHLPPHFLGAGGFAVDDAGNAYVTYQALRSIRTEDGYAGFPETDYFITKLDADGNSEFTKPLPVLPRAIAVDAAHNIYLTATTNLEDLPVSDHAFQPQRKDHPFSTDFDMDLYVAMLDPTASSLLAGTYLGGKFIDLAGGIAVNPQQPSVVYLAGGTQSPDFPTKDPLQPQLNNSEVETDVVYDGFITVLDLVKMELVASTFLGGSIDRRTAVSGGYGQDLLSDIALDQVGHVYVVGETNALDFPVANPLLPAYTPGPSLSTYSPPFYDFVIAKLDAHLSTLEFSTYFGGSGQDSEAFSVDPFFTWNRTGPRLSVDPNGTLHVAGTSKGDVREYGSGTPVSTDDFPRWNAAQPDFGGGHPTSFFWDGAGASDAVVLAIHQRGTLAGRGFSTTQGREFNHIVAGFTSFRQDASPGDFTATIDWGDGTTSNGHVRRRDSTSFVFLVEGVHAYGAPGVYPVVVHVEDHASDGQSPISNIDISHWEDGQTGGSIAVDLAHPNRLFAAMTDQQGAARAASSQDGGMLVATSLDAGATWSPRMVGDATDTKLPPAKQNPDVLFDKFGNLFLAYEGSDGNNIVVAWSTDGGRSFDAEHVHELVPEGTVAGPGVSSVGSPKLAFSEFNNEVWVTFEDVVSDRILVAVAGVGGLGEVGSFHTQPVTGSTGGLFSDIAVGPDGSVAVAWQTAPASGSASILSSVDPDGTGPRAFSTPTTVATSSTTGELAVEAQQESVPLGVTLAWDNSDGPHRGRLYAAFVDMAEDLAQGPDEPALFVTLADGSATDWSTPRRVSLDPSWQSMFLPSIAVDPATGAMAVGWYGTRGSLGESASTADFYVATSLDGVTFSNAQRASVETSNALNPDLSPANLERGYGASPGMAFVNGRLYPLWSDNSALALENNFEPQFEVATAIVGVVTVHVPPVALKPLPIQAVKGELFDGLVATFTSADSSLQPGNFEATIQWGDGGESPGLVLQPEGPGTSFQVFGKHMYAETGGYPLWVRVHDIANNLDTEPISNITAQQGSQAEPTIAIDPSNPDRVFAAGVHVNVQFPLGIPVAGSLDGGVTWLSGTLADGTDVLPPALGDTRAVFDQFGNLFVTYLTPSPERHIVVLLSTNGGEDFSVLATFTDVDKADQPSIAVGPGAGGADGSVWLTWERGDQPFNVIMAAGAPVTGLGAVGAFNQWLVAPLSADGASRNFGDIAVGPDGQVLLTYTQAVLGGSPLGPAQIAVHLDPDGLGSVPFGPPTIAADIQVGSHLPIPASAQRPIDAEGNLAWDVSDGEHRGRVYLVYTDSPAVGDFNTDIYSRYSDDNGQHWSEPIQINDADPNSQFLPSVAVDQSSGNVGVAWYTAVGAANVLTRFTATLSDDGGSTWNRIAYLVSPGESDATDSSIDLGGQRFQYGDYTGLSFVAGTLQPIWADNSLELDSVPDPRSFDLVNARIAVAHVTRAPLVAQTFDMEDREGNEFTQRVASFTDPDGTGSAGDYKATIEWGDGSEPDHGTVEQNPDGSFSVLGTHEYEKSGRYSMRVVITGPQTEGEGTATAVIENAPLDLLIADNLRVVRELEFTQVVATLSDLNRHGTAADFIVTIEWGDGSSSVATLALQPGSGQDGAPNTFNITGTHKYLSERTFSINVSLLERPSGETLARTGDLISGDPPLEVNEFFLDIEALEGINTGDLVLVTFERADDVEVPLDTHVGAYIATINWGDGQVDANIIPFMTSEDVTVVGQHTYATAGEYYPSVTLVDDSGGSFSVQLIAIVEPDVTSLVSTVGSGLVYDPVSERFVGELTVTNTSNVDIDGPLYVVFHDLPAGVVLENIAVVTGAGDPVYKADQSRLAAGASLPPIALEFSNPGRVPISYTVQVFDGLRPEPVGGASLVFEPNHGQASDAVSFIARGQGYAIGLTAGNASLVLSGSARQAGAAALMEIVGANPSPLGVALDPQPGVSNYFSGNTSITAVPHYGRVRYAEVYAGIDVEYYGQDGLLEYDWIVRPGADPDNIALRFVGVDSLVMDRAGNLRLQVPGGELVQRAPVAYQIVAGAQIEVASAYEVRADGTIGFALGAYDPTRALVIDPVLVYSTYLGGSGGETAAAVAVDAAGNTYVTGETGSPDFFTVKPFDPELNQPETSPFWLSFDAFVAKFDPQGVLVYSSYLGGGSTVAGDVRETIGQSIAVDSAGQAWIGGSTQSSWFPTTTSAPSGFEPASSAGAGFLTKLSADGSSILYSALIRSTPLDLAVDDAGDVYATGIGFALKLDSATNTLRYVAPVFGVARGIAIDSVGQAYVAGFTDSPAFPTKNALFPELHNRRFNEFGEEVTSADAFVMKLSFDGDVLFATYLGGQFADAVRDIAVDRAGVIHIVGQTESDDLPVPGGLDTSLGGTQDGFLIRLANDGSSLLYGTYVGGGGQDSLTGVGVDAQGRTYVSGATGTVDLPTVRAHQPAFGGGPRHQDGSFVYPDGFAASIAADGGAFTYLTYLGGGGFDEVRGVAVDPRGNASFVGVTNSPDLLTRNSAQSRLLGIQADAFIVRLLSDDAGTITLHNRPLTAVEGSPYNGLVAFFATNGSETADQFSAIIDWGDGVSSAGTIAGNSRDGFQILGNHVYSDVGAYDVFVTLRDSLGRIVTATSTGAVTAAAEEHVLYHVAIDTATWVGTQGLLSFQFNPGAVPGSPDAEARITALNLFGGAVGGSATAGDVSQVSSSEFILRPSTALNRLVENVALGPRIEFDLGFTGPGLSQPSAGNFADVFALQLLDANGVAPLLSADATASILRVHLAPDGSTRAESSGAAVTVAASGRATVTNGRINVALAPVTIQEGLEFNGPVATFTSGNPRETAAEFSATIDWGDGSPVTVGGISGSHGNFTVSGAHVYQTVGSYALAVTVVEPDGLAAESATGRSILAAQLFNNDWGSIQSPPNSRPVSGDFNGDGILDVAVGGFWPNPTIPGRGVGILLGRGDGSFELGGFQPSGNSAIEIAVSDFNNDGKLDVAAAIWNRAESVVELLLGNGDGTLQPSIQLAELRNPGSIAAADFNRDGHIDLAYTESFAPTQHTGSNTLKIALGNGSGDFGTPTSAAIQGGFSCHISTADMDGDAVPDIVLSSFSSLEFLRGVGDGSFEASVGVALGAYSNSPALEDLDGDGVRDVAAVDGVNLNILRGRGDGTFDAPLQIPAPQSSAVVAADFNGDGRPDLAAIQQLPGSVGSVRVFINDGAGNVADGVAYEGITYPSHIAAADFDRDGHIDLATSGTSTVISVLPGIGDGTFASAVRYASGIVDPSGVIRPQGVLTADVNGDSHVDAVLLTSNGPIITQLGNGDGTFQSIVTGDVGLGSHRTPVLADFNNDGRLDLAAPLGSGIGILFGEGDGAFPLSRAEWAGGTAVVQGDFNHDGRLDLATANVQGFGRDVSVYLANADGTFPAYQDGLHYATGSGARSIVTGDFNGDSRLDLAVANGSSRTVSVLLGNADGTFAPALNIPVGTVVQPTSGIVAQALKTGDFNSDGRLDLVVLGHDGSGRVLPGNGDGSFGTGITFTTTTGPDGGLTFGHEVAVGDFNADGKLDFVVSSQTHANFFIEGGGLSVLLGNGDFTFQDAVTYSDRARPTAMTLGDFNGDGRLDIASANVNNGTTESGLVGILLGNPDGTFQTAVNYATIGANPRAIAAGDLNADGIDDLAVVNGSGDTAILLGNRNGTFQPALNYATSGDGLLGGPIAVTIDDFNGDGRADVVAGRALLFGSGDGTFSNQRLFTYVPPVFNADIGRSSDPHEIAAGDLNGDGHVDLVVAMFGTAVVLSGNGNGSFLQPIRLTLPAAANLGSHAARVGLADLDGDGDLDVVAVHQN